MPNIEAAPVPVQISQTSFSMKPLTNRDNAELNNFIRMSILASAEEFCKTCSEKMIEPTMKAAMDKVAKIDWMTQPEWLEQFDTLMHIFWIGVRDSANCSKEEFYSLVMQEDVTSNIRTLMDALSLVNPILRESQKKAPV